MNFSNYRLSLDIHETESGLSLRAKKGDTIRKIYVTLMDGGVPYRITSDCTAAFTARKPDNTILFNDALIENNAIVYELTPQTTSMAGQVRCEVRLYGGDGRLITSPRFFLDVDDTVFTEGDEVVSEDEYTILEDAIDAVNQAVAEAGTAVEEIRADLQQRIQNGEFTSPGIVFSMGDTAPAHVPALWFQTSPGEEETPAVLSLSEDASACPVQADVDGVAYGVENASVNQSPAAGTYDFTVL